MHRYRYDYECLWACLLHRSYKADGLIRSLVYWKLKPLIYLNIEHRSTTAERYGAAAIAGCGIGIWRGSHGSYGTECNALFAVDVDAIYRECVRPLDAKHYKFVRPACISWQPWTPRPRVFGVQTQNVGVRDAGTQLNGSSDCDTLRVVNECRYSYTYIRWYFLATGVRKGNWSFKMYYI